MEQAALEWVARHAPQHASSALATQLWSTYLDEWAVAIRYIPGVQELVAALSSQYRLGIVTNTHHAPLIHKHLHAMGIAPYMQVVITSVEYGKPKPHAGIFEVALDQLGCRAASTLFVGDSYTADYLGAKGAGMQARLIDPAGANNVPAHEVIQSVLDLKTHITENVS